MKFNFLNDLQLLKHKDYKQLSDDERMRYKKAKRLKRKIQVYFEISAIAFVIVLIPVIVLTNVKKDKKDKVDTVDSAITVDEEDIKSNEEVGLKVSATISEAPVEDVAATEKSSALYSAKETDLTVNITDVISEYGIIINNDTDEIIATKNAYDKMIPASMTKVMTIYSAWKRMTPEQLDEKIILSDEAVAACYKCGCSTSGFVAGEEITVRDLFYGTILPSGGDAAEQLAMYIGGDRATFMDMVNDDLKELGLSETTHFTNPIGYYEENHYSTAYDIAMIMKASLEDDFLKEVLSTHVYYSTATNVNPEGIIISNWFLRRIEDRSFGGTILGAKTGYVNESGSCAVSSEVSDSGVTYIVCTGKSSSSWKAIADHVSIYNKYAK